MIPETPKVESKVRQRFKMACFNCGGEHNLAACKEKRNQSKINAARREFTNNKQQSLTPKSRYITH